MSDLISRKKLKEVIEPMVGKFEDDGSFWWSRESILGAIDSDFVEADEPIQEELTKMAWCKGFNAGVEYAKKSISLYIKEMGYAYKMPTAHELYEELEGE